MFSRTREQKNTECKLFNMLFRLLRLKEPAAFILERADLELHLAGPQG